MVSLSPRPLLDCLGLFPLVFACLVVCVLPCAFLGLYAPLLADLSGFSSASQACAEFSESLILLGLWASPSISLWACLGLAASLWNSLQLTVLLSDQETVFRSLGLSLPLSSIPSREFVNAPAACPAAKRYPATASANGYLESRLIHPLLHNPFC